MTDGAPKPEAPDIQLITSEGETTLLIDGGQAMQAWEHGLMIESANLLCQYGSNFLEAGLGLGLSALHIARHPATRCHVVVEKFARVIELFRAGHPDVPASLTIVQADFFDHLPTVAPGSVDGIFFDPYLPESMNNDVSFWNRVVPQMVRALRVGGVLIPCFTSRPVLRWQFEPFFDRVICERRSFESYATTEYMPLTRGSVFIQCFIRCR
jgi:SAM-dependent methyltransferase